MIHASQLNSDGLLKWVTFICSGGSHPDLKHYVSGTQARIELFKKLGIPYGKAQKIPGNLQGDYEWNGFLFKLFPGSGYSVLPTPAEERANQFSNRAHRLYITCPLCPGGKLIPVGRMNQHCKIHRLEIHERLHQQFAALPQTTKKLLNVPRT